MSKPVPTDERLIIVLGETGVGKSTWINSMVNYLKFSSLEEAMNGKKITLINDANENKTPAASKTICPSVYSFSLNGVTFRLIDTPGFNDTKGSDQDTKNFEKIFAGLTNFPKVHAICILIKATDNRLNDNYKNLMRELMKNFHVNARSNFVFCYTNVTDIQDTRDFEPANVLNRFLTEAGLEIERSARNQFYFNNSGNQYLQVEKSLVKNNVIQQINWEESTKSTKECLNLVRNLPPHLVRETDSINRARNRINSLIKPICDVTVSIDENSRMEKGRIKMNAIALEKKQLFCYNCETKETIYFENGKSGNFKTRRNCTGAIEPSLLFNVAVSSTLGNIFLFWTRCPECGCAASSHDFIGYKIQKETTTEINSPTLLENEKKCILDTCAQFSAFLRDNSLINEVNAEDGIFKNDVFVGRITDLIQRESEKSTAMRTPEKTTEITSILEIYKNIARKYKKKCQSLSSSQIDELVERLYSLEIYGSTIKILVTAEQAADYKMTAGTITTEQHLFFNL